MSICSHIKAKGKPDFTTLHDHLQHVVHVAERVAEKFGFSVDIAKKGAILHDIGKTSPIFQERLKPDFQWHDRVKPFRHEIASLFFLSLFPEDIHPQLIEMVIAHHKPVKNDVRDKGLIDLDESYDDVFRLHAQRWDEWSKEALEIIGSFGIPTRPISLDEAELNYQNALSYVKNSLSQQGYSLWKGLLMASDHFASAMVENTYEQTRKIFKCPNLNFFERKHKLFPLSLISADSIKKHTIVVASTGAGKTDYLFRRCQSRIFYTLPFQASINAMYKRVANDLFDTNPDLDIRVLHSSSAIVKRNGTQEEIMLQGLVGSSIKILTPHQISGILFGTRGFEATILDLKGNDVILDEIHTYTEISRAIVIKMVEVLNRLNCRIHIGTATMPTSLYQQIIEILGKDNVHEVSLAPEELDKFDRHIVYKIGSWENAESIIDDGISDNKKILVVCNRVSTSQQIYTYYQEKYPDIPVMLIHSRFKRGDRNIKEQELIGVDEKGNSLGKFNTSNKACIAISTQVVEVSLDISFDLMITEAAPLDALIQRFGRVNRKRTESTIGKYKPVYVIAPSTDRKEALPYDVDILQRSYDVLPHDEVLRERDLQQKLDTVFPEVDVMDIETHSIFKRDGRLIIDFLTHRPKSYLLDLLEIDSVCCILDSDIEEYENSNFEQRMMLEIPARYWQLKGFPQCEYGNKPYIVPSHSYSNEFGFDISRAKTKFHTDDNFI